jgi:hypothetical protein
MDDGARRYSNDAILNIGTAFGYGFADGRLADGRPYGIRRLDTGMWQAHFNGADVWSPADTWQRAAEHLEHKLAGCGIWLRLQG